MTRTHPDLSLFSTSISRLCLCDMRPPWSSAFGSALLDEVPVATAKVATVLAPDRPVMLPMRSRGTRV